MGLALGPTLTSMGFLYVDDCFVIKKNEKGMESFYKILNEARNSLKFTVEKENNNEVYIKICRKLFGSTENKPVQINNTIKRSSFAEHSVNIQKCAKKN